MNFLKNTLFIIGLLLFLGEKNTFSHPQKTIVQTAKKATAAAKKAAAAARKAAAAARKATIAEKAVAKEVSVGEKVGAKEVSVGEKVGAKEVSVGEKVGAKETTAGAKETTAGAKETKSSESTAIRANNDPSFVPKPWATTPKSPKVVLHPEGPYQVRMDPRFISEGKPMAIDTSKFKKGTKTLHGGIRNADEFWAGWAKEFPTTLSAENMQRVQKEISPVVDDVWIKAYPEHAKFKGERIIHHHLDYGAYAIPIPNTVHSKAPGWSIWHYEHAAHPLDPHIE